MSFRPHLFFTSFDSFFPSLDGNSLGCPLYLLRLIPFFPFPTFSILKFFFINFILCVLMENEGKTRWYELLHHDNKEVFIFLGIPLSNLLVCFHF